jgi:hypothetical protein
MMVAESPELYEVWVVPHDTIAREDLDMRFSTFETTPELAVKKIKRYLTERKHFSLKMKVDFVVHRRPLIE